MATEARYVNLDGAQGSANGTSAANAWALDTAFITATSDTVIFTKIGAGTFTASAGLDLGNTNVLGSNKRIVFACYKNNENLKNLGTTTNLVSFWQTDMDVGGEFYGGAIDAYRSENGLSMANPNAVWGHIDGEGALADDLITITAADNIGFRNFKFSGTDGNASNDLFVGVTDPENTTWENCIFDDSYRHFASASLFLGGMLLDCYLGVNTAAGTIPIQSEFKYGAMVGCIQKIRAGSVGGAIRNGICITHTVFIGGTHAFQLSTNPGQFNNCTFLNQTTACVKGASTQGKVFEFNNIFNPNNDVGAISLTANTGNVMYSDYSLYFANGGSQHSTPWLDDTDGEGSSFAGPNVITDLDPRINLQNLIPANPILGKPDMNGNRQPIGAILVLPRMSGPRIGPTTGSFTGAF